MKYKIIMTYECEIEAEDEGIAYDAAFMEFGRIVDTKGYLPFTSVEVNPENE